MCSLISAFDSIRSIFQSAFSATQQEALKLKNLSVSVDQLALFAAPAYKNHLFLPCFDSIKNIDALPFSVSKQAAFNITEMFKPVNQLALLGAPVGYHRSVLRGVESVVDAATLAGSGAFKIARDVLQSNPILRFDGFREDVMLRPVFPLEHNRITDVPKTERPLIRKKNCPEEERVM